MLSLQILYLLVPFAQFQLIYKDPMRYWWVNHKQTFRAEVGEGYIWSPFTNNNGSRNQSYDNLPLTQINDVIFSYAGGLIRAVGIISKPAISNPRPASFGHIGEQWSAQGWLVEVNWILLRLPISPKDYIDLLSPLLPEKYSPIQANGNGNQGIYLASLGEMLGEQLMVIVEDANLGTKLQLSSLHEDQDENNILQDVGNSSYAPTTRTAIIQARTGQGPFRTAVEQIESFCRLTKVNSRPFLIASHIKPWRCSNDIERLDGHNGFLLSPHVDKLFDKGYISFSNGGGILIAHSTVRNVMVNWKLDVNCNVGNFSSQQKRYLQYHQEEIYERKRELMTEIGRARI